MAAPSPIASSEAFHITGGTEQTVLGGAGALVRVRDDAYVIVRNTGGTNNVVFHLYTSPDGTNFSEIPMAYWNAGIPASTNPQPMPVPPASQRGEYLRVTASSTDSTIDVEIWVPELNRRSGGSMVRVQ